MMAIAAAVGWVLFLLVWGFFSLCQRPVWVTYGEPTLTEDLLEVPVYYVWRRNKEFDTLQWGDDEPGWVWKSTKAKVRLFGFCGIQPIWVFEKSKALVRARIQELRVQRLYKP